MPLIGLLDEADIASVDEELQAPRSPPAPSTGRSGTEGTKELPPGPDARGVPFKLVFHRCLPLLLKLVVGE